MILRSQPWRLKSRLGERSPPAWTKYIKASGNPRRRVLLAELRFQPPSEKVLSVNQALTCADSPGCTRNITADIDGMAAGVYSDTLTFTPG